jgi:ABC-type phosphate transport system auxiliary subunit
MFQSLKADIGRIKNDIRTEFQSQYQLLKADIQNQRQLFETKFEDLSQDVQNNLLY